MLKDFQKQFLQAVTDNEINPAMLEMIRPIGKLEAKDVVSIYRDDYQARMQEALGKNYEGTWVLLGDEDFFSLAQQYIKENPSSYTNLTVYGESWPEFLLKHEAPDEVMQMASFERFFWKRFHQSDVAPKDIDAHSLEDIQFSLANTLLIKADFKLYQLWLKREDNQQLDFDDFEGEQWLLVYRSNQGVKVQELTSTQFRMMELIKEHQYLPAVFLELQQLEIETSETDWTLVFEALKFLQA